jgi:hypothetical protein
MTEPQRPVVPEYYVDQFRCTVSVYTAALTFGLLPPHPPPSGGRHAADVCVLRMSPEHAKVLAMILRRAVQRFEEEVKCRIVIPATVLNSLGLSSEDWT